MTSRDYLRQVSLPSPTVTSIQQAVEMLSGEALRDTEIIPISLAFEENLRDIRTHEGMDAIHEYFAANPTHTSAKDTILSLVHRNLGLIHFYTASEKEVKCWCGKQGKTILECSSVVDVNITRYAFCLYCLPTLVYSRHITLADIVLPIMHAKFMSLYLTPHINCIIQLFSTETSYAAK